MLWYLSHAAQLTSPVSDVFDIGGPEVLPYSEMLQKFAKLSGLRRRLIIKIPVLTPRLASHWIGFVTPLPAALAKPLVGSLISEVVADPEKSIDKLIPPPKEGLLDVNDAMIYALTRIDKNQVQSRWSDATAPMLPWQKAQSDPSWAGEMIFKDHREVITDAKLIYIWETIEEIGGETGWYGSDWLWWLRGLIDRSIGGVGLRRGRRDPKTLRVGDGLDFWRVEALNRPNFLKLYAEMILPGKAWLEFRIEPIKSTDGTETVKVIQEATFSPRGLGGQLYWFAILPMHAFIFPIMLRNIVRGAKRKEYFKDS